MKRIFPIFLAVVLLLSLSGCSASNEAALVETQSVLQWPDHKYAAMLPIPKSTVGEVQWEYPEEISIYVGDTSEEDYLNYVTACASAGFSTVKSEENGFYQANNEDGYRLALTYLADENAMTICVMEPIYKVQFEMDCLSNLLFSKYGLKFDVDGIEIGSLEHGGEGTFETELKTGTHTLTVVSADDSTVKGTIDFEVTSNFVLRCKLSCSSDAVEIEVIDNITPPISPSELGEKSYDEVRALLASAGFVNIGRNEVKDLTVENKEKAYVVSSITIDGNSDFSKEDTFFKNSEVVLEYHTQMKIEMPMSDDDYAGMNYSEVETAFRNLGFTNIELIKFTTNDKNVEDGSVDTVEVLSWAFGNGEFLQGDTFEPDCQVRIYYNEREVEIPNLTTENCEELAEILSNKAEIDPSYSSFAISYSGRIIEFDGRIDYVANHGDFDTRYDILVSAGDYNPDSQIGPVFKFEDVAAYNLDLDTMFLEDEIWVGRNVRIIAEVDSFNSNSGLFYLKPVSVTGR